MLARGVFAFPPCCLEVPPCPHCREPPRVLLTQNYFPQLLIEQEEVFLNFSPSQSTWWSSLPLRSAALYWWAPPSTTHGWVGGWDCCRKQWTLHQPESASWANVWGRGLIPASWASAFASCDSSSSKLNKEPPNCRVSHICFEGGSRVAFVSALPCLGRECQRGGCLCSSEPRVRALNIRAGGTRKVSENKTLLPATSV